MKTAAQTSTSDSVTIEILEGDLKVSTIVNFAISGQMEQMVGHFDPQFDLTTGLPE
jgi:hypothetical protein